MKVAFRQWFDKSFDKNCLFSDVNPTRVGIFRG